MTGSGLGILNDCDIKKIINRRTGKNNSSITSWCLEPIPDGGGFMGSYYQLRITINSHGTPVSFIFFAKTPPPPGPQRDFSLRHGIFNKEIVMYNEIVPQIGIGSGAKWSPECYYCIPDVIIVMENLIPEGYSTLDKYVPFGYEELACLFDTFARFHSRSLIQDENLRQQGKNLYDNWGEILNEGLVCDNESSILLQKAALDGCHALVDLVDELGDEEKKLLKKKITIWSWNLVKALKPSKKYRNIICHRDVWSANFMFKVDDNNGKLIDCRLIDFQFYSYIYPGMDLMLAMYMNSSREIRDNYFNLLIELYYDRLKCCLKIDANLNIDKILPLNLFLESCEVARPNAMIYALNNLQITLSNKDVSEKYFAKSPELLKHVLYGAGRNEYVCPQFLNIPQYKKRITENIIELYECLPDKLFDEYSDI
ncbi:hypothetical protein PV326_011183 [Microctonus aethiopoides]|nr:hypothetical protein PV326_011183 [Microctonus aethiopoides]